MTLAFFKYCYFWIDILEFLIQTFEPAPPICLVMECPPGEPDVKPKVITKPDVKSNKEYKQDVKPNIRSNKELTHDVKMIRSKPDTNKIT